MNTLPSETIRGARPHALPSVVWWRRSLTTETHRGSASPSRASRGTAPIPNHLLTPAPSERIVPALPRKVFVAWRVKPPKPSSSLCFGITKKPTVPESQ